VCMCVYACVYLCVRFCVCVFIYLFIGMLHYIRLVILHAITFGVYSFFFPSFHFVLIFIICPSFSSLLTC
jgi:hypothetical protein